MEAVWICSWCDEVRSGHVRRQCRSFRVVSPCSHIDHRGLRVGLLARVQPLEMGADVLEFMVSRGFRGDLTVESMWQRRSALKCLGHRLDDDGGAATCFSFPARNMWRAFGETSLQYWFTDEGKTAFSCGRRSSQWLPSGGPAGHFRRQPQKNWTRCSDQWFTCSPRLAQVLMRNVLHMCAVAGVSQPASWQL